MPRDINGLLKSTTRSRSEVIVIGAIAMSASCKSNRITDKYQHTMIIKDINFRIIEFKNYNKH